MIFSQSEFAAARDAYFAKYGERIVTQAPEDIEPMRQDCAPLAKYMRVSVDQAMRLLAKRYLEQH